MNTAYCINLCFEPVPFKPVVTLILEGKIIIISPAASAEINTTAVCRVLKTNSFWSLRDSIS